MISMSRLVTRRLLQFFGGVVYPWFFMFLEVLYCCFHIWSSRNFFLSLLPFPMHSSLYFAQQCDGNSLENWTSTKAFVYAWLSKAVFSKGIWTAAKRSWSQFMSHCSVLNWNQSLSITQHMSRSDSFWVPWHMVLDPTVSSKALLPGDECWFYCCGAEGDKNKWCLLDIKNEWWCLHHS